MLYSKSSTLICSMKNLNSIVKFRRFPQSNTTMYGPETWAEPSPFVSYHSWSWSGQCGSAFAEEDCNLSYIIIITFGRGSQFPARMAWFRRASRSSVKTQEAHVPSAPCPSSTCLSWLTAGQEKKRGICILVSCVLGRMHARPDSQLLSCILSSRAGMKRQLWKCRRITVSLVLLFIFKKKKKTERDSRAITVPIRMNTGDKTRASALHTNNK